MNYETKRAIAVWMARAWAVFVPIAGFAFCYVAFYLFIPALGFRETKLYPAIAAGVVILLNWPELGGDLLRALRYPAVKK